MKSYKELKIYKISYGLAIKIHTMSLKLPQYELYEEGSQVRRLSKSVARNMSMKMRHFHKTFSVSLHHSSTMVC
jgi:four helix bundle protein